MLPGRGGLVLGLPRSLVPRRSRKMYTTGVVYSVRAWLTINRR